MNIGCVLNQFYSNISFFEKIQVEPNFTCNIYIYVYIYIYRKVHEEICIFLIYLFCSYMHVIYMYLSSLLLSSENMCGTRPFKWGSH